MNCLLLSHHFASKAYIPYFGFTFNIFAWHEKKHFFVYKMNKQNRQTCILPSNHCWFLIYNINSSSGNKYVSIPSWFHSTAYIPTVFIFAVSISSKHCLFLKFNRNSSFFILNTVFSVNSTDLLISLLNGAGKWYL